jgi:hypothetical protein
MAEPRNQVDWDAMERPWRAGIVSVLQLSKQFHVSRAAICKHWAKVGIERDLGAKIRAKADSLVAQAAVTQPVTPETRVTEKSIVDANAQMQADIITSHRKDITRARNLANTLMNEVEFQTGNAELLDKLEELLLSPEVDPNGKLSDAYHRIISLSSRSDTFKKLVDSLKTVIALDRQAFGIDKEDGSVSALDGIKRLMKEVDGMTVSLLPEGG